MSTVHQDAVGSKAHLILSYTNLQREATEAMTNARRSRRQMWLCKALSKLSGVPGIKAALAAARALIFCTHFQISKSNKEIFITSMAHSLFETHIY